MPELTRRKDPDLADSWHVYFGHIRVGTITRAVGTPNASEKWCWDCGFYPGCELSEHRGGTAESFEEARAAFERAWLVFSARRTEADYQTWRDQRDWTAKKYAAWDRGEKLPAAGAGRRVRSA